MPVPPNAIESVEDATTAPVALVVRSAFVRLVIARLVVVALVVVAFVKSAFTKCEVEEAKIPWVNQMGVEVEFTAVPKLVPGVYEKVPEPEPQVAVMTVPEELVVRHCPADAPSEEITRLVVEAVPVTESTEVVAAVKFALTKCEVEEAKMPFCAQIGEVVAAVITP